LARPTQAVVEALVSENAARFAMIKSRRTLGRLDEARHRHLPIVDDGRVGGIVSRYDLGGLELGRLDEEIGLWERI
jgi:CBS domain-containing protein